MTELTINTVSTTTPIISTDALTTSPTTAPAPLVTSVSSGLTEQQQQNGRKAPPPTLVLPQPQIQAASPITSPTLPVGSTILSPSPVYTSPMSFASMGTLTFTQPPQTFTQATSPQILSPMFAPAATTTTGAVTFLSVPSPQITVSSQPQSPMQVLTPMTTTTFVPPPAPAPAPQPGVEQQTQPATLAQPVATMLPTPLPATLPASPTNPPAIIQPATVLPTASSAPTTTSTVTFAPGTLFGWVINLDNRPDRLQSIMTQIRRHGLQVTRHSAVNPKANVAAGKPPVDPTAVASEWETTLNSNFDRTYKPGCILKMTNGELGCAMSHVELWRKMKEMNLPYALILEDDVTLADDFTHRVHYYMAQLPRDWDILYLDYQNGCRPMRYTHDLFRAVYVWHTGAYLISQAGVKKVLEDLPVDGPVDNFLAKRLLKGRLNGFLPIEPLAIQPPGDSDIEHSHTNPLVDQERKAAVPFSLPPSASHFFAPGLPASRALFQIQPPQQHSHSSTYPSAPLYHHHPHSHHHLSAPSSTISSAPPSVATLASPRAYAGTPKTPTTTSMSSVPSSSGTTLSGASSMSSSYSYRSSSLGNAFELPATSSAFLMPRKLEKYSSPLAPQWELKREMYEPRILSPAIHYRGDFGGIFVH